MRFEPPVGFDVKEFFSNIYTFQKWEIFPGHWSVGPKDVAQIMGALQVPADLRGLRVLDIAPWNGFFGFECARRGAKEVLSLGPDDPDVTGYNKVRALLDAKNMTYVRDSVYNLDIAKHGKFDCVFFLGLIYHLRHPLLALDKIYDVAKNVIYIDTPVIDKVCYDKTVSEEVRAGILLGGTFANKVPMLYFTGGDETGDPFNWFLPNAAALRSMVKSSGFEVKHQGDDGGGWGWITARKGERKFEVGLEGYNPLSQYAKSENA